MTDPAYHLATVQQMLAYCHACHDVLGELSDDNFEYRRLHARGLETALQLVGEAAGQLPDIVRQHYSVVDWDAALTLREIRLQSTEHVDSERATVIVRETIPALVEGLQAILDAEAPQGR